jgi:hypothetical protein
MGRESIFSVDMVRQLYKTAAKRRDSQESLLVVG